MEKITNYEDFNKYINQEIMILIAKTKSCVVCKPIAEKLRGFMENFPTIPSYEVYLEEVELFQGQQLVFTVPTVLVFSQGKEILRESRFINFEKIERLFNLYLS